MVEKIDNKYTKTAGVAARVPKKKSIDNLFGCLKRPTTPLVSVEEMNKAIANKFKQEYR